MKHKRDGEAAAAAPEPGGERKGRMVVTTKKRPKAPLPRRAVCVARGFLQPVCSCLHKFLPWLRGLKGWSLDDLAGITHLDKSYLCDLENRKESNPSLDVISRLADAFGLKLGHFIKKMERFAAR